MRRLQINVAIIALTMVPLPFSAPTANYKYFVALYRACAGSRLRSWTLAGLFRCGMLTGNAAGLVKRLLRFISVF